MKETLALLTLIYVADNMMENDHCSSNIHSERHSSLSVLIANHKPVVIVNIAQMKQILKPLSFRQQLVICPKRNNVKTKGN